MAAMRSIARAALLLFAAASSRVLAQGAGWETFGPPLFQVSAVATPADNAAVYAASSDFGAAQSAIFQSPDGGIDWHTVVQAAAGEFYSDILVDPGNPATLYAGAPASGDGTTKIYRSANTGGTWSLGLTIPIYCVPSFAPGAGAGTAFVSCGTRLFRTTDAGQSWQELANPFLEATRLTTGPGGLLFGYGATRIFKSANGGDAWSPAGNAPGACAGINALGVSPADANALVAGTGITGATGFQCGGVFRSADGGTTWTAASLSGVYVADIEIDRTDPSRVYASAGYIPGVLPKGGVFDSLDGGSAWSDMQIPVDGATRLALSSSGDRLYAATSLGVYAIPVTKAPPTCTPDDVTLCLNGGRFRVRATWTRPDGTSGSGHAVALTGDTGDFWFFNSANVEAIVKVLDGCVTNGHRWVFASGLTNVMVNLTVTDVLTGATMIYTNPQGTAFVPIQDTSAFLCN
jgi:photosystem II stability/assembly factor-like uncharacterized protein